MNENAKQGTEEPAAPLTKRQIKRAYLRGEIGLSEAIPALIFDHGMMRGEAFFYLEA